MLENGRNRRRASALAAPGTGDGCFVRHDAAGVPPAGHISGVSLEGMQRGNFCRWRPAGAGNCGKETNEATASEGTSMKYQKPKVVAKSAPKQSFAAGCPTNTRVVTNCSASNYKCDCGPLK